MTTRQKRIIWHVVRIGVTAGLIVYILVGVNFAKLSAVLGGSNVLLLVGAVAMLAGQPTIGALRWRLLLKVQRVHLKFREALRLTYLGLFFNNCLPSMGGDAVKAYYIAKHSHRKAESVVAIFVDRAVGVAGLILLGSAAVLFTVFDADKRLAHLVMGVVFVAFFGAVVLFFSRRLRRLLRVERLFERLPFRDLLQKVDNAAFAYRYHKRVILIALAYTWIAQGMGILAVWIIGLAVGVDVPLYLYVLYMPVVWLVWVLPISINGLGTAETTFLYFFNAAVLLRVLLDFPDLTVI
ncbi:MAG: lysylphosphatidylglycerol synthase transmembrane domain-containing protein, partial [Planctomycetia bacterium]|nr:lysylphosphatidylglycerol synthase transmembrane domain-containing protein [Planctomycetia bacterium]